jgi:hypothetical protein
MKLLLLALVACGASTAATRSAPRPPPARTATAGDDLLALLPAGADVVAELDLSRLRANPAVGGVVAALEKRIDRFHDVEVAVAAVYRIADAGATTVVVLRGSAGTRVVGKAPEAAATLAADASFLALRAAAMPPRAAGAIARVTARLDRPARIAVAGKLGLDEVPASISLWLDVADDAALVALLGGDDEADAARLADLAGGARARAEHWLPPWAASGRLGGGDYSAKTTGRSARVVWTLGPRRLADWARDAVRRLEGAS